MKNNNIQQTAVKIAENIIIYMKNKIRETKERIASEQEKAKRTSKGLSFDEVKNELQCMMYSNKAGNFIMSYCEFIMYALSVIEIITFFGRTSNEYTMVNVCFEGGILEIFIALAAAVICLIKNKHKPVFVYSISASVTYFLRLNGLSYYSILNSGILALMLIIDIHIIKRYIKNKFDDKDWEIKNKKKIFHMFKDDEEDEDIGATDIMIRCKKCGNICTKKDEFCGKCGEKLDINVRSYESGIKSKENKSSDRVKKSSINSDYTVILDKTEILDKTMIMDNIEEKIIKHTEDELNYK